MTYRRDQNSVTPTRAPRRRRVWRRLRAEGGFTLIEALVAATVLVVGLITAASILVIATHSDASVRAREGAVTLARQVTEDARSLDYSQISSSTITSSLQAMPGLANTSSGSNWTVTRGPTGDQVTYTIAASVASLNDAKVDTSGATTDVKQVTVTVSWNTFNGKTHSYSETTTMTAAGQDPGLIASALQLNSPTSGYAGSATAPVIITSIASLKFQVSAPSATSAIVWTLNGGKATSWAGSTPTSGNPWISSAWSLSGVSDGTYTIGAQAEDANGVLGPAVTIPVRLIRNVPAAPTVTNYGFNSNLMVNGQPTTEAEVQWASNSELNVVGYQVTSQTTSSTCQTSTTSFSPTGCSNWWCFSPTACTDLNSPSDSSDQFYNVQALYYDSNNVLRAGTATTVKIPDGTPSPPGQVPLVNLQAVTQPDNTAILTWTPPVGGTTVSFYRIYRDGDNYSNRYDTVAASTCSVTCTYHDTNRTTGHDYYITAVSSKLAESAATGPVNG